MYTDYIILIKFSIYGKAIFSMYIENMLKKH